jgi:carbonic anhydrase/acetyltransferase-like protein (isoleucine patch superfamily)
VAAGTLIPEGMEVPPRSLVMGLPGKVRRPITEEERQGLRQYAQNYFEYKETYLSESEAR